jgi:hypothetical protein
MALVKGNKTANDTTSVTTSVPYTATITTHTHNIGADGALIVNTFYVNTRSCTGVTWNGVAMTKQGTWDNNDLGAAGRYDVWYLANPDTGNHDLVETYNTSGGNVTTLITSFTGADQTAPIRQSLHSGVATSPHSQTITILAGSMIMGIETARQSYSVTDSMNIDGTGKGFGALDIDTAISLIQLGVWTRNATLTAGTKTVTMTTNAPSFLTDNVRVEIQEAGAPPAPTRRRMWIC